MKVIIVADTEDDQDELEASKSLHRDIERALTGALCLTHVRLDLEIALDGFVL